MWFLAQGVAFSYRETKSTFIMKRILFIIALLAQSLWLGAQINPNDLAIGLHVINSQDGTPVANHTIQVYDLYSYWDSVQTDANGFAEVVIPNGSLTGPNQMYYMYTMSCDGTTYYVDSLSNNQGTVDTASIWFSISCGSISGSCDASFNFSQTGNQVIAAPAFASNLGDTWLWTLQYNGVAVQSYTGEQVVFDLPQDTLVYELCLSLTNVLTGCTSVSCQAIQPVVVDCNGFIGYSAMSDGSTLFYATGTAGISGFNWSVYTYDAFGNPTSSGIFSTTSTVIIPASTDASLVQACLYLGFETGCTWSDCQSFYLGSANDSLCDASFSVQLMDEVPGISGTYQFTSIYSGNEPGLVHVWDFSNGYTADGAAPIVVFTEPGEYTVCHWIMRQDSSCWDERCDTFQVGDIFGNGPCSADFSVWMDGNIVTLVPDSFPQVFGNHAQWYIGNEFPIDQFATSVYLPNGVYPVCLSVWNDSGCQAYACDTIVVTGDTTFYCQAYYNPVVNGLDVQFQNWSYSYPNQTGVYYIWDFGDGTQAYATDTAHSYAAPGWYTVTLTMYGSECTSQYSTQIYVDSTSTSCSAQFTATTLSTTAPYFVQMSPQNGAYNGNFYHQWTSNDGQLYQDANPLFFFNTPGIYEICHVLYSVDGTCTDSLCMSFTVSGTDSSSCSAYFMVQPSEGTQPGLHSLVPFVQSSAYSYVWTVNGQTYTDMIPSVIVLPGDSLDACLSVYGNNGCYDQYCTWYSNTGSTGTLSLFGTVFAGANPVDSGTASLYVADSLGGMAMVAETPIVQGYYAFSNLSQGVYYVLASLDSSSAFLNSYVPTYFGSQYYWALAEPINLVGAPASIYGYPISLIYAGNSGGPGGISGMIDSGPNRLMSPEYAASIGAQAAPMAGAHVIVTDLFGNPQRWVRSSADGSFALNNLNYGTYRLLADMPGMPCVPIEFTISPQIPNVEITLVMGEQVTAVVEVPEVQIGAAYPNPAQHQVNVPVQLQKASRIELRVSNLAGQIVSQSSQELGAGNHQLSLPLRQVAAGTYLLQIQGDAIVSPKVHRIMIQP
jgi:hypothetical protein